MPTMRKATTRASQRYASKGVKMKVSRSHSRLLAPPADASVSRTRSTGDSS